MLKGVAFCFLMLTDLQGRSIDITLGLVLVYQWLRTMLEPVAMASMYF